MQESMRLTLPGGHQYTSASGEDKENSLLLRGVRIASTSEAGSLADEAEPNATKDGARDGRILMATRSVT